MFASTLGLPSPQVFHAVIMGRFAAQCLIDMSQVCNKLVDRLGEETATLGLRVGIHSGPVTVRATEVLHYCHRYIAQP